MKNRKIIIHLFSDLFSEREYKENRKIMTCKGKK